jgi:aspartyl-tRNA(Asn)/glutamyl-tRNA(Gln) amidotransferase subunit A
MNPYARDLLKYASNSTAVDFTKAVGNVDAIKSALADQFDKFDLLVSPTMPVAPYECGKPSGNIDGYDVDGSWAGLAFTYPINSSGHPAASIPAGLNSNGLPIGLHIIGKFGDEATIIKASAAFEKAKPWNHLRPPVS